MREMRFTIFMEPPSGNHYVRHTRRGIHYKTREAEAWYKAMISLCSGERIEGKTHEVEYTVYQGKGSRGDVDNYAKCVCDGLVKGGALKSDASVVRLIAQKKRDRLTPRTEIILRALG